MEFDYIVVGAGSAGCAVASRLTENPKVAVLVVEAGPRDANPLFRMPKGFAKLMARPEYTWNFPVAYADRRMRGEVWQRGKVLGGSSAINGMIYNRGNQADFDHLAELGNPDWGWDTMLAAYKSMEDNAFGASPTRGAGGPLHVSPFGHADPVCDRIIEAGTRIGLEAMADCNESDAPRIGYTMCTVRNGRRVSAAQAFLHPFSHRPNLRIQTGAQVVKLLRQGDRICGVVARKDGALVEYRARREVVLSLGCLGTPRLLQLSGIGPADVLRGAGVDVIVDSLNVGANLREHRSPMFQFRLNQDLGYNRVLRSKARQAMAGMRYFLDRGGIMSTPGFDLVAFFKTRPELSRPDAQILITPLSSSFAGKGMAVEREPGLQCLAIALRPESQGTVSIASADPDAGLDIAPNFFSSSYDRQVIAGAYRVVRDLFSASPIAELIDHEIRPGSAASGTDEMLAEHALTSGFSNYHGIGTAAMGPGDDAVIDQKLRVRGVRGLRVVDSSAFPTMVSAGTNAPAMALGWQAGQVILSEG